MRVLAIEGMIQSHKYKVFLIVGLALGSPAAARAGSTVSGSLPQPAEVAVDISGNDSAGERESLDRCLASLGMRQTGPARYRVQVGRAVRLKRVGLVTSARDADDRSSDSRVRAKAIEVASVAFIEIATGEVVFKARLSRRSRPAETIPPIMDEVCPLLHDTKRRRS